MQVLRMDHAGIVVDDLAAAKNFFTTLGLESLGTVQVAGEWVERIIGLDSVHNDIVMMAAPGGSMCLELIKFHSPLSETAPQPLPANAHGIRHIAFAVDDIEATVVNLQNHGTQLIGEIVNYQNLYKLCYVRGPEGIIVELAEKVG